MGTVTVVVPPVVRQFVGGQARVAVSATTVREALEELSSGSEPLRQRLFDETNEINRFIRIFVDGRPTTSRSAADEPVQEGSVVNVLLALAGG